MPSGVWCLAVEMLDLLANDEVSAGLRDGGFQLASFRGVGKAGILVSRCKIQHGCPQSPDF